MAAGPLPALGKCRWVDRSSSLEHVEADDGGDERASPRDQEGDRAGATANGEDSDSRRQRQKETPTHVGAAGDLLTNGQPFLSAPSEGNGQRRKRDSEGYDHGYEWQPAK